jgi:hypothetical protein
MLLAEVQVQSYDSSHRLCDEKSCNEAHFGFRFDYHSRVAPHTKAQLDFCGSPNQPAQYYHNLGPQFMTMEDSLYWCYAGHCPLSVLYLMYTTFLVLAVLAASDIWLSDMYFFIYSI